MMPVCSKRASSWRIMLSLLECVPGSVPKSLNSPVPVKPPSFLRLALTQTRLREQLAGSNTT